MDLDPRLYLVTGAEPAEHRLAPLFDAGVTLIQVRDKRASDDDLARRVERALEVAARYGVCVLVNDRVSVARRTGAHGVHLGQSDVAPVVARAQLGPTAHVGISLESEAQRAPEGVSYAAVSPVFATPSKADVAPPLGLDGVRSLRAAHRIPLVGIGGIDVDRAAAVIEAGADGVAVISAIWSAPDPAGATRRLRDAIDSALAARTRDDPAADGRRTDPRDRRRPGSPG